MEFIFLRTLHRAIMRITFSMDQPFRIKADPEKHSLSALFSHTFNSV